MSDHDDAWLCRAALLALVLILLARAYPPRLRSGTAHAAGDTALWHLQWIASAYPDPALASRAADGVLAGMLMHMGRGDVAAAYLRVKGEAR